MNRPSLALEETNPIYRPELFIDITSEELPSRVAGRGLSVVPGFTGKHGNILCIRSEGSSMEVDAIILLVSPDTGRIYADNPGAKALVEELLLVD